MKIIQILTTLVIPLFLFAYQYFYTIPQASKKQSTICCTSATALKESNKIIVNTNQRGLEHLAKEIYRKPDYQQILSSSKEIDKNMHDFVSFLDSLTNIIEKEAIQGANTRNPNYSKINLQILNKRIQALTSRIMESLKSAKMPRMEPEELKRVESELLLPNLLPCKYIEELITHQNASCAGLGLLTLKNKILISEKKLLNYLMGKISWSDYIREFWIQPLSLPNDRIINKGEYFESKIFLAELIHNYGAMKISVDGNPLAIKNGVANYKELPKKERRPHLQGSSFNRKSLD